MKSIKFPDMFTATYTNLVEGREATAQNIKTLMLSNQGELFGDPEFGTQFKKLTFEQNDAVLTDLLRDSINTSIAMFIPQINTSVKNINISKSKGAVNVFIKAINQEDYITDLYSVASFTR